jgi:hypothetical protein
MRTSLSVGTDARARNTHLALGAGNAKPTDALVDRARRRSRAGPGCRCPIDHQGDVTGGTGPRVVVANHGSFIDGLALILCLTEPATFVSGDEFASQHIAGPFLRRLGCEFVHRSGPQLMAADASRLNDILREGGALVYFPEGSLDWAAGIRPFNRDPSIQLGGVRRSRRRRAKPGRASGRRSHPSAR